MNDPRPVDIEAEDDSLARSATLDQYWECLQRESGADPQDWLRNHQVEDPTLIDDLEVVNLWHQLHISSSTSDSAPDVGSSSATPTRKSDRFGAPLRGSDWTAGSPEAATGPPPRIGKYLIIETLSQGGQGQVFRVVHPELGKDFVLKRAWRPISANRSGRDHLSREGRLLANCDHPNLVRVVDLDVDGDRPFVVMEYVPGLTLQQFVEQHRPGPRQSARLVAELARAVAYLHAQGIIHQDIKPENVLIDDRGRPRLIDLGLARLRHAWCDDETNWIGGTYAYMSPEQALGRPDRIGPWTDIFGLGGLLYYLLTGCPLYRGLSQASLLGQARKAESIPIRQIEPRVPRSLERICQSALALVPEERCRTAQDLGRALRRFIWSPSVAAVSVAVLALLSVMFWVTWSRPPHSALPVNPAFPALNAHSELTGRPRILVFDVQHFRSDGSLRSIGAIGKSSDETQFGDTLRVLVSFDAPAYCYLIALNSNGTNQLCYPEQPDEQPSKKTEIGFPNGVTKYFGLTDGPGLQAFLVLASLKPLPPYSKWSPRNSWHWKHVDAEGVWSFDGRWIQRIGSKNRGVITTDSDSPKPFQEVCESLPNLDGIEVMQAIAFPVKPKE
jgi:serine/threonine protein kinase